MLKIILCVNLFIFSLTAHSSTTGSELIGGNFKLLNLEGKTVTADSLKGKYLLIFFGFTHCPSVCPLGVNTMMAVYSRLKEHEKKLFPIFITIDPEVDTVERLQKFKKRFRKGLITLRGSQNQTDDAINKFRGYYAKKSKTDIDHSPLIYFMNKDGKYIAHFTSEQGHSKILEKVLAEIKKTK
jgi:cytochrome oxidase Cu insertion factor (SCO1/SenC/PrrC family)